MSDQRNAGPLRGIMPLGRKRQQAGVNGAPRVPGVKDQHWPGTVMGISVFIALFTLAWLGRRTFIDAVTLLRGLAVLCTVGTLLPYGWSGLRLGMEKLEWFLFNVLAIGPLIICAGLAVNHFVHGPVRWSEASLGTDVHVIVGEGDERVEHTLPGRGFFAFSDEEEDASTSGRYRVGVARGCLGYWSVVEAEVLP